MPAEYEEEFKLLSGFLNDRVLIANAISEGFKPFMLSSKSGRIVCNTVFELYGTGKQETPINKASVKETLIEKGIFKDDLKDYYSAMVLVEAPPLSEAMAYMDILKMKTGRKRLLEMNKAVVSYLKKEGENKDKPIIDFAGDLIHQLTDIQQLRFKDQIQPVKYTVFEIDEQINESKVARKRGYSIAPFKCLEESLSGLRKGLYYGLAGAPRRGKTTMSLHLASFVAANNKIPVLYYSWEQTTQVLTYRLLGSAAMINPTVLQIKKIKSDPKLYSRFNEGREKVSSFMNYLYVLEGGRKDNFDRIKAHAYNLMQEYETDEIAIFIDYLQKMPVEQHQTDPQVRINTISSGLAELSLDLNCPVFAISSIDKEGCKLDERNAKGERPTMHHSTGSGDIEYDLDCALILYKDWYDTVELHDQLSKLAQRNNWDEKRLPKLDIINLSIEKNRDAPPGMAPTIQYLFFIEENRLLEMGYKDESEEYTYNRIAQLIDEQMKAGNIFDGLNEAEEIPEDTGEVEIELT